MMSLRVVALKVTSRSTPEIINPLQASLIEQRPIVVKEIRSLSQVILYRRPNVFLGVLNPNFQTISEPTAEVGCGLVASFEESQVYVNSG